MAWHNGYQVWLTEKQSLENGQLVANFLLSKGWTPESISATLGNMRHESSVNPNMYEYGKAWEGDWGFGLVQWTPRSKYWNWALQNGYSESELRNGDAQLARMDYEVDQGIQWISTPNYPETYAQYRKSKKNLDYLTNAFCWNYERPNLQAGIESMPNRIAFAKKCFNELDWSGGGGGNNSVPDGYQLAQFPMDNIDVSQGEYGDYTHTEARNEQLAMDFMARDKDNNWLHQYPYYAPFDSEVIDIYHDWAQVIWRSTTKVFGVNGKRYDVITYSTVHDWNYNQWSIGDRVKQGDLIGHTGDNGGGGGGGDHLHLQLFNTNYHPFPSTTSQQLHIYDVMDTSNVKVWFRDGGYPWKTWEGENTPGDPDPPDPDVPDPPDDPKPGSGIDYDKLFKQIDDKLEDMLKTDVYKVGQSDYYKNSFITLSKQMDNTYKIKPNIKIFENTHDVIKSIIDNILP